MKIVCFAGHRYLSVKNIDERLKDAIEREILNGAETFLIGTYGDFDLLALSICKTLKTYHKNIEICVVINSLSQLNRLNLDLKEIHTVMYDIGDVYFKQKIIATNQQMIKNSDVIICYVDEKKIKSGAKITLNYARKYNKKIINLFQEQDNLFYNKSEIEKRNMFEKFKNS